MKKILLCALIGLSFAACKSNKTSENPTSDSLATDTISKFKIDNISVDTAVKMVNSYNPGMVGSQRAGVQKENTRTVYFDLASLKTLINKIESQKGQGVRIYFAAYGPGHRVISATGDTLDYSNSNTVVLVSTKDTVIVDPNHPTRKITVHKDYYSNNKSVTSIGYFLGRFTDPQNKGELCPPPSPCCTLGATLLCTPPPVGIN